MAGAKAQKDPARGQHRHAPQLQALGLPISALFEDFPSRTREPAADYAARFSRLIRNKSAKEKEGILRIVRAATENFGRK